MLTHELITELQKLSRAEKLRVMQLLVNDLASEEESFFVDGAHYEIWSPYDSASAAHALNQMLTTKNNHNG